MSKEFTELPEAVQSQIRTRNRFSDEILPVHDYAEKADFLVHLVKNEYVDTKPDEKTPQKWNWERASVCKLVDIISDYTWKAAEGLAAIQAKINEDNKKDREEKSPQSSN